MVLKELKFNKRVKEKKKQTNLDRYGVEYPIQSKKIKDKVKQTNLDRYGVENSMQSEEIRNKMHQTMLDRYGVEHANQVPKFFNNAKIIRYAIDKGDTFLLNKSIFNVLTQSAENVCKELKAVKSYLSESSFLFEMTGSGSAFYSFPLKHTKGHNKMLDDLKNSMPKEWAVFCAQTC